MQAIPIIAVMGIDMLDHTFRLEKEFDIRIPESDLVAKEGENYIVLHLTVGDWHQYLCRRLPDLEPSDIARRQRQVLEIMLGLDRRDAMAIKDSDRLVEDLQFE